MTNYMIRYIKLVNSLRLIGLSSMASAKRFNHVVYPSFLGGKSIKVYVREQSQDLAQM